MTLKLVHHCKKRLATFPSPAGISLTKLSLVTDILVSLIIILWANKAALNRNRYIHRFDRPNHLLTLFYATGFGMVVFMWWFLKGTVSRDFLLKFFFHESPSPKPLIITLGIISNFFENSRRYSQVKVHHRCQRHRWQICHRCQWQIAAGINNTGGKFASGINDTGGKFCHQFPLCCWHRWQIMGTI